MNEKIIQIMPCNMEIYAVYKEECEDSTKVNMRYPVLGFALCENSYIYPLVFDAEMGIDVEDGTASNFIEFERR